MIYLKLFSFFFTGEVALPSSGYSTRQMKPGGMANHSGVPTEGLDHTLGLGELAGLTVTDEAGSLSDVSFNHILVMFLQPF